MITLTISEHVANLTRSSYFHLRRLRAISPLSCLYLYCPCLCLLSNRLLQFSPGWSSKVRLSPLQSVLNTAARLIAPLPRICTSYITAFMFDHLRRLPLIARVQLKLLTLIFRSHIGQAPRYLRDLIRLPSSAISLRPLRSLGRHDLFHSFIHSFRPFL